MNSDSKKPGLPSKAQQLLEELLRLGLINSQALDLLPGTSRAELAHVVQPERLLHRLIDFKLLTSYQVARIRTGKMHGLVLGKFRVLDRLGGGSAGVPPRGEHRDTGQQVAIKVLIPTPGQGPKPMLRFFAERKTVAQLSHPGIVRALDVGEAPSQEPDAAVLYYYVMEHVPGFDLERHVEHHGPMPPSLACDVAYQVADALTEANRHNLVHRDIKPANIMLTPEGKAMLLDFGLVRDFQSRQTAPGTQVGVLEWIAPEQALDAHAVDIRADIYSLGCTLFWCLTAQSPRKGRANPPQVQAPPTTLRSLRPDLAPELEAVVARMMASVPDDRYPTPQAVMKALMPFVSDKYAQGADVAPADAAQHPPPAPVSATQISEGPGQLPPGPQGDAKVVDRPAPANAATFWQRAVNWLRGRKKPPSH